jgi:hypothetical protein
VRHKVNTGTFFDTLDDQDLRAIMATGELDALQCARLWRHLGLPGEPPDVIHIVPYERMLVDLMSRRKQSGNAC